MKSFFRPDGGIDTVDQHGRVSTTFPEYVTQCLDSTAATVRGWRKPHLRLHYNPRPQWALGNWGDWYPWSVQMVRDMRPNYGRPNVTTNQHYTAAGALRAARVFWWPSL